MKIPLVLLPGDGIGPEVVAEAMKALEAVAATHDHEVEAVAHPFGASGLEEAGSGFPDSTRDACAQAKAIFLGAVGDPRHDHLPPAERPEVALLHLRRLIEGFANLRPIVSQFVSDESPFRAETLAGVDMLMVRELTGGLYFGEPRGVEGEGRDRIATNTLRYSAYEIERITRFAFDAAMKRDRRVMSVDKANVLETSKLWREVVEEVASDYPEVALEHVLVDRAAMEIVSKPSSIDVMVTSNLFGDILSDEASMLAGSLGLLPSATLGGKYRTL